MVGWRIVTVCMLISGLLSVGCATSARRKPSRSADIADWSAEKVPDEAAAKSDLAVAAGRIAEENGETGKAMELFTEAVSLNSNNADAHWRQAIVYAGQQKMEESSRAFETATRLDTTNPALYADYGYHLYLQNRLPEAEESLRTAIRLESHNERAHNNLGLVLAASGRDQDAIASFLEAGCDEASARSNLAFVQTMRNDLTQARGTYQSVLAMNPSAAPATTALHQLNKVVSEIPDTGNASVAHVTADSDDAGKVTLTSLLESRAPSSK